MTDKKQWDNFHKDIIMDTQVDKDYEKFLKRFYRDDKVNRKVLDIGCGQGTFLAYTSYYYKHWIVYGIDYSWKGLSIANCRLCHRDNVKLKQCNAEKIDYPDGMFDMISVNVLFASIDPGNVIGEIKRLLKSRGKIFIKELSNNSCNMDNKYIRRGKEARMYNDQYFYDLLNSNRFEKIETYKSRIDRQNVEHVVCIGRKK